MRWLSAALLVCLVSTAVAEDRAPRPRLGKVTLRVRQVFPETHEALVFDKATNKRMVVTEGDQFGKYEIVEVGDDEVVVRINGREVVLPADEPAAPATPAPATPATDLLDPYADPAAPASVSTPAAARGPVDPYAAPAAPPRPTAPAVITEVLAPPDQRASGTGPVDPYAPVPARPASPTPATPAPAPAPPAAPPAPVTPAPVTPAPVAPAPTPAVEAIRVEAMTIKRGELSASLADFDKLQRAIGFVRTPDGVKLTTIAPGSYFHGLGLRSGDVVTAIDGAPLRSLDDAAAAYARLGAAKKLALSVDRAGAHGTLRFTLK